MGFCKHGAAVVGGYHVQKLEEMVLSCCWMYYLENENFDQCAAATETLAVKPSIHDILCCQLLHLLTHFASMNEGKQRNKNQTQLLCFGLLSFCNEKFLVVVKYDKSLMVNNYIIFLQDTKKSRF